MDREQLAQIMIAQESFLKDYPTGLCPFVRGIRTRCFLRLSLLLGCLCCQFTVINLVHAQPLPTHESQADIAAINAEMNKAIEQVKAIVNQPVGALRRTSGMKVSTSSPGWFHEGATRPNFNTVDIRATQETPYADKPYVTSDLNPGFVFVGSHLEFNSMTKYFYTDRSLPKKKLSQAEMLEINRLYRIIGKCEKQLTALQPAPAAQPGSEEVESELTKSEPARKYEPVPRGNYVKAAIGVSLVLIVYFVYRRFR